VLVERADELLRFHLYSRNFPIDDRRLAVLDDKRAPGKFGDLSRLLVRGEGGWRESAAGSLGEEDRDLLNRLGDALHRHMLRVLEYRRVLASQKGTADERHRGRELLRTLDRHGVAERELIGSFMDLVERLAPTRDGPPVVGALSADGGVPTAPLIRPERGTGRN
jgi:hypothetical protein